MTPISDEVANKSKLSLKRPDKLASNKTLVLDLDETLVHCIPEGQPADVHLVIRLPSGGQATAGVNIREGVAKMLATLSPIYEIIVFTASQQTYADYIGTIAYNIHQVCT